MPYQGSQGEWYDDQGNLITPNPSMGGYQPQLQQPGFDPASIGPGQQDAPPPNYAQNGSGIPGIVDAPVTAADVDGIGRIKRGPTTVAPPPPASSDGGGGDLVNPFPGQPPPWTGGGIGDPPVFTPPGFTPPPAFKDPTAAEAAAEPGYDFGLKTGLGSVQASAAARGVLNSGGTLKDIFDYGNNAASQNYQNVDNRARGNYLLNYQTQYMDPYKFQYQSALDAFAPKMAQYAAQNNMAFTNTIGSNNQAYNTWLQQYQIYRNRLLDSVNANTATS